MKPSKPLVLGLIAMMSMSCQLVTGKPGGLSLLDRLMVLGAGAATRVTPSNGAIIQAPTMTLIVPQGAVDDEVTITYTDVAVPAAKDDIRPVQAAYRFGPEKLQFNKPATLKICYDASFVAAQGLQEKTLQIQYHDPATGKFVSMGGDVDLARHCVTAPVYHFSTYVLTAQLLAIGDNAPTIGGASFFPGTPIAGLPVTVRTSITDWDAGSAIANARFYYRTAGSGGVFKSLALVQETNDTSAQYFTAQIPAADVSAVGLEYYIEAFDTLNKSRLRPTTGFDTIAGDVPDATTPIRFQQNVTQMSAGFSRDLTVQVKGNSAPTYFPVPADTLDFAGGKGTYSRPTWLSARYKAEYIGSSSLDATYGSLTVSLPIAVYPGMMKRIEILYAGVVLPNPFEVDGPSTTQLDAAGYDAFDNFMFVLPTFGTTGGIGSFSTVPALYGRFAANYVFPDQSGTITATIGSYTVSRNVLVRSTAVFCQYDTGLFDSTCVLGY